MIKLRAFIFGTVMHLYWGYPQGRNYTSINILYEFLKKFTFCTFWLIGKHAKDTKFISGIPHTDKCTHTDIGTHRQIPFLHFTNLIFGTPHTHKYTQTHAHTLTQIPFLHFALFGIHAKDIWHTTDLHMHRHSYMHTYRHTDVGTLTHTQNWQKSLS